MSATEKIHIIMVGSGGVGKSALAKRMSSGSYSPEYHPTRADTYSKSFVVDNARCSLDILDTAGQESFSAMRDNYYRGGDGFFCVFSITDRASFINITQQHDHICRVTDRDDPPVILIGNKSDLAGDRQVSEEEAKRLASSWEGNCIYVETSAKDDKLVEDAFRTLVRNVIEDRRLKAQKLPSADAATSCCVIM